MQVKNTGTTTVYVGGSAVTTASGFPVSSTDGVANIPNTGAASEPPYGIAATTATATHIWAAEMADVLEAPSYELPANVAAMAALLASSPEPRPASLRSSGRQFVVWTRDESGRLGMVPGN